MLQLIGFVLIVGVIAGGLVVSGGPAIFAALPFELSLIVGAAIGTLLIGNAPSVSKQAAWGFVAALRGPSWKRHDYQALLATLHQLLKRVRRGGIIAIEEDIENPQDSDLFKANAKLLADTDARDLICSTFRIAGLDPSAEREGGMRLRDQINAHIYERHRAVAALNTLADALPALGIVAAVLGIIKTMGVIDESPAVLGEMIAAALLGTFLGVFLAYGLVGPLANRFGQVVEEDSQYLETIGRVLAAHFDGVPPMRCIEQACAELPAGVRPNSAALDQAVMQAHFPRVAA
ncbi:MAG: motility-associated protein [Pseudomonadota bacterium]